MFLHIKSSASSNRSRKAESKSEGKRAASQNSLDEFVMDDACVPPPTTVSTYVHRGRGTTDMGPAVALSLVLARFFCFSLGASSCASTEGGLDLRLLIYCWRLRAAVHTTSHSTVKPNSIDRFGHKGGARCVGRARIEEA